MREQILDSTFWSDDNTKRVSIFTNGIVHYLLNNEIVKAVDLSYLNKQEIEDRAEEYVQS